MEAVSCRKYRRAKNKRMKIIEKGKKSKREKGKSGDKTEEDEDEMYGEG